MSRPGRGGEAGGAQTLRGRAHMGVGRKALEAVAVAVLAVGVAVLAGEDAGAADGQEGLVQKAQSKTMPCRAKASMRGVRMAALP